MRLVVALSLLLPAAPGQAQVADDLLARVARQGTATGSSAGEAQFLAEVDRARSELLPDVRLQQSAHWDYSGLPDLSLGVAATVPLEEPQLRARHELALKGLELARHNAAAQRRRELYQLRRSLRMLAHLQEMESLLDQHHTALLEQTPALASLEVDPSGGRGDREAAYASTARAPGGDEVVAFLEVDLALQRTRGERQLLAEAIERRHSSAGVALPEAGVGRPTLPPLPGLDQPGGNCLVETDETRRARLVREEEGLAARLEAARADLRVTLDVSGEVRHAAVTAGPPWQLEAGVGVNLALPVGAGLRPSLSLGVSPSSLNQNSSLGWPGRDTNPTWGLREAEGQAAYLESIREAEISARQAQLSFEDALRRVRLRRAVLARFEDQAAAAVPRAQTQLLQARADLLAAELDRDLAHLELTRACGSDEQGGWGLTS